MPEGARGAPTVEGGESSRDPIAGWRERWQRRWRSRKLLVRDHSMEPALRPGDRLLLDPLAYRDARPRRGDVVVIHDPAEPERLLVKRVVGTPGDFVRITTEGAQWIGARATGVGTPPAGALEELEVPLEHLFVLSDRPARTRDSRQFGPVPMRSVRGRVWFRYYPSARRGEL